MQHNKDSFAVWWRNIRKSGTERQRLILLNWLKFSCKTVAMRGDHNQQRVVYTIYNRYKNSQYALQRTNAKRVYQIVNAKQIKYKSEMQQLQRLKQELDLNLPVKITHRRSRKIIARNGDKNGL